MAKQQYMRTLAIGAGFAAAIIAARPVQSQAITGVPIVTLSALGTTLGVDDNAGGRAGPLAVGPDGALYGTTEFGGMFGMGCVYVLAPPSRPGQNWTRTVLYSFNGVSDFGYPVGGVVRGPDGTLYGSAAGNGDIGMSQIAPRSAVFALRPPIKTASSWTEQTIATFEGATLTGRLLLDGAGALYGTAQGGGRTDTGQVFRLRPPAEPGRTQWIKETLYTFTGGASGAFPQDGLARGADGSLFGTTGQGGDPACRDGWGCGTVFKLVPAPTLPWRLTVLHAFHGGADGDRPIGNLLVDASGSVLGTTYMGGVAGPPCLSGCGTVFRLSPAGSATTLYSFCGTSNDRTSGCPGGMYPAGGLVRGLNGRYYGTAELGGANRVGTVWALDQLGRVSTLASLQASTGVQPSATLAASSSGMVVGTTAGIAGNAGSVFSLTP